MRLRIALPAVVMSCSDVLLRLDDLSMNGGYQGVCGRCGKYGQVIFGHRCLGFLFIVDIYGVFPFIYLDMIVLQCIVYDCILGLKSFRMLSCPIAQISCSKHCPHLQKTL